VVASRVGDVLASKYRLQELLGSGGMGYVYRAVNEDVGRVVAIKMLRAEHAENAMLVERFLREARAANLVRHPNVVDVLDIGRDGDGSPFIVQELLTGQDLAQYVEKRGGRLTLAEIEEYLLPVIDAVGEAHKRGVVHRDLKPENVFLAEDGGRCIPKLLDFGISKIRLPDIRTTEVGTMMGTPAYMAPEQIHNAHEADPRVDVWALGVMLFQLLSGRLPFPEKDAPALFVAIATRDAPRLIDVCPDVSPDVSRICERCLRRPPDERYPTALELARDLRHVLEGTEIEATGKHVRLPLPPAGLEVPDLELPPPKGIATDKTHPASPAAAARDKIELVTAHGVPAALSSDDGPPDSRPLPSLDIDVSRARPQPPAPAATVAAPPESVRSRTVGVLDQPLPGVMLGPTAPQPSYRREVPLQLDVRQPPQPQTGPDVSFLVGLAVVGLSSIGVTAVLRTFAHQPEVLQLVGMVTSPTPTLNLAVHGGLALVALAIGIKAVISGVRKWRELGGRPGAVITAVIAGALFFAAIELARAAW